MQPHYQIHITQKKTNVFVFSPPLAETDLLIDGVTLIIFPFTHFKAVICSDYNFWMSTKLLLKLNKV